MIRSLIDYGRFFARSLMHADERALLLSHRARPDRNQRTDPKEALRAAITWLMRAQGQNADGGMGSYHLVNGWGASYPETTGYLIPTLLAASEHLNWPEPTERAIRAAEWLLTIQRADGGWQGGRIGEGRPSIVFNTAQAIRGMLAAHNATKRDEFLVSATRAATWIIAVQEEDGAWRKHNFLGAARVYDAYVDAPLLKLHSLTGDDRFTVAAERNLAWILSQQQANGWFANCDNTIKHNDRPITHTLAYTIDGLIECGIAMGNERLITAARKAADRSLERFLTTFWLNGRYAEQWRGSGSLITTGCAQLAIAWARLHAITGDARYAEGLHRMCDLLIAIQQKSSLGPQHARGAMPGSYPIWGRYEKFAFPNWATKYFADALLCAEGRLPAF